MQNIIKSFSRKGVHITAKKQVIAVQNFNFATGKEIKFGNEARALILEGCEMLADAV